MGQAHGVALPDQLNSEKSEPKGRSNNGPTTMEALVEEATAFSGNENESLEERAQKALNCPCVAELRKGPCGTPFSEAFLCFLKSTAEEKGLKTEKVFGHDSLQRGLYVLEDHLQHTTLYNTSTGSECTQQFLALQSCIKENPNAFDESLLEDDKSQEQSNAST